MKVLMISKDPAIFERSDARSRMVEYGALVKELHIIVFAKQKFSVQKFPSPINSKIRISENVFAYPVNSRNGFFRIFGALRIGKKIIEHRRLETEHSRSNVIQSPPNTPRVGAGSFIITSQDPFEAGLVGWLLKRKSGFSLQLQIHTDFLSPFFRKESVKNRIRVLLAKFLLPRADCVRAVSERIKQSLHEARRVDCDSRITVLPIFVDREKIVRAPVAVDLHRRYPKFGTIVLMASRLTREKNIGLAVRAMSSVARRYPETGLIIVGDGPERSDIESRIMSEELRDNVILEEAVNFETLISYYKTADLFLLTSNYEGYGRTVVEASTAGLPVVMTDVGVAGHEIMSGKNGIIVPVGDHEGMRDALMSILGDPLFLEHLKAGAAATAAAGTEKTRYLALMKHAWEHCGI